jgi:hypothetical protein
MNPSPLGLSASKALVGYFNTEVAEGLSPRTLRNYEHRLKQLADFISNVEFTRITPTTSGSTWPGCPLGTSPLVTTAIVLDLPALHGQSREVVVKLLTGTNPKDRPD